MNPRGRSSGDRRRAFTLIELLVVLVIIGILAALIYSTLDASYVPRKKAVARAQLQQIATAINAYHARLGFYPPDNPNNPAMNQLYFELLGTTNNGTAKLGATNWVTLDRSAQISSNDISSVFGVTGFANTSPRAHSDDQFAAATSFLGSLYPNQVGSIDPINSPHIKILVCPVEWPADVIPVPIPGTQLNPWRYNSSHPVNNPGSYDLWVDLVIRGKTYRIGNWNK
jgi:prepilin-type N-terminal cleavage/methylation domain-containing protein